MKCLFKTLLAGLAVMSLFACSKANDRAPNIDPRTGKHPAGWAAADTGGSHPAAYLLVPTSCYQCHGKDLKGGISAVSCFSASRSGINCHPAGPSGHPAGWDAADAHGAAAKALLGGSNGMPHCGLCHGADFSGGFANKSCLDTAGCHGAGVLAAHSPKPWRDVGRNGARTHTSTDESNAPACAVCHLGGANSSRQPVPAAPAGTAPGCFNNTLCHGVEGHATGWSNFSSHGRAAKAAAGGVLIRGVLSPLSSFATCTTCHGSGFDGGTAQQSCLNSCHGVAAPHPARPWRSTTGGVTHVSTDTSNAGVCASCHSGGANSTRAPRAGDPVGSTGCFNNTLCHGAEGHPAGWNAAAQHGAAAKGVPASTTGFSSCQSCHGSTFNNGSAPSCMNTLGCHGLLVSSPHPAKPWFSTAAGASTHTSTDQGNAGICAACHTAGANSTVVPPNPASGTAGCFNNTLCHFHQIPFAPPAVDPSVHGGLAKQDLRVCQSCHGVKGSTSFDGLALSGGITTIACSSCHSFAKAHPTAWQGTTTNPGETVVYSHRTAANIANACIICHDVSQGRTAPLAGAPSCFSTTFTNGLGQAGTCHASGPGVAPHAVPYPNHNATARSNFTYCLGCHPVAANAANSKPPGCQNCHLSDPTATPTGCTSCHANPPAGAGYPNSAGTHAPHVSASKVAAMTLACADCHNGLGLGTLDHLNRARARSAAVQASPVVFSSNPLVVAGGGTAPAFTGGATGQCTNVYCHGAKMPGGDATGGNRTPAWGSALLPATISAAGCGVCHGFPPSTASGHPDGITIPAGFPASAGIGTTCSCHANINPAGNSYANIFVNRSLHINGVLETPASGHAFPNPGSAHRGSTSGCTACHAISSGSNPYPVAVGTPPTCRSCHLNADPSANPHCSDCHGSAANDAAGALLAGRPAGGTAFPNRPGEHNRSEHIGRACTVCHPFASGDPRHGWSNRLKSSAAQVGGAGTSIILWNPAGNAGRGSCQPSCHGTEAWY
jgi:predicted CxxxxCH...CXXCH cytochrome family protein